MQQINNNNNNNNNNDNKEYVQVIVRRVRVATVAMEMRQCVPFALLSSYEKFSTAANNTA